MSRYLRFTALAALLTTGCTVIIDGELADKDGDEDAGPGGETCTSDEQCISFDPFNCNRVCNDEDRCVDGIEAFDGTRCGMPGSDMHCVFGECVQRECGDGFVDRTAMPPEFCDDGNDNDADGCNNNCTRSCVPPAPPNCDDGNPCNGAEMCIMAMGLCRATPPAADGTACGAGGTCEEGFCFEP